MFLLNLFVPVAISMTVSLVTLREILVNINELFLLHHRE